MSKLEINKLTNANVYINGNNYLGRCEEVDLPDVAFKMSEHKALGLTGTLEFPSGIEKLEARLKFSSLYPEVAKIAANPYKAANLQLRANLETYSGNGLVDQREVVCFLQGSFNKFPAGKFKSQENAEFEATMSVTYLKLVVAGETLYEIDVMQNIYKVGGVDILAEYRQNVGG